MLRSFSCVYEFVVKPIKLIFRRRILGVEKHRKATKDEKQGEDISESAAAVNILEMKILLAF